MPTTLQPRSRNARRCCSRCDAPQGEIVILDSAQQVCGACIDLMGNLLAVAERVAQDLTPPIECGFIERAAA